MKSTNVQFAVVREDPEIELSLIETLPKNAQILLIGSGGCTALSIRAKHPHLNQTLIEPNPAQIKLITEKEKLLKEQAFQKIAELNQHGNFESLFRSLKNFINEFIIEDDLLQKYILENRNDLIAELFQHKFWPVAFDLFFSDSILNTMFGPDATQHAPKNSYPGYFKNVFERGLMAKNVSENYFIHHILLGKYVPHAFPYYLTQTAKEYVPFEILNCMVHEVPSFANYDFLTFSNIFDWCSEEYIKTIADRLKKECKPGAMIVFRQLNHSKNFQYLFENDFVFDDQKASGLLAQDRSLFYSQLNIAIKK